MVVVLALVLAAIYGVYRLMKSLSRPKAAGPSAVKLLASTPLGPGKTLHVIGLGSKAYLIGSTDSSISLVAEIEDKDFVDALALEAAISHQPSGKGLDFGELLAGLLGNRYTRGRREGGSKAQVRDGDFLAGQRERLRKF